MAKGATKEKKGSQGYANTKKTLLLISMVAPGAIWLLLIRYLPMFGIIISFKDYKVYTKDPGLINNVLNSAWVGLKNFKFLFATTESLKIIRNTLVYNGIFIVLGLVFAVAFAIMLNEVTNKFVAKTYQTLMFFPYFLSWVVASYFLLAFFDATRGLIPTMQKNMGVDVTNWYGTPSVWPAILIVAHLWKNLGYSTILYLAAITGIDQAQYEAASIDGATKWQQIKYITIPHLKSMIIILFIMNVGKIVNADFGLFYSLPANQGTLYPATMVIDTYIYNVMMTTQNMGMSTAAGFLQNIVGFICIMTANTIVRKIDADSSLF